MDRRRFAPSAEGLESRALMASLLGGTAATTQRPQNVPVTYEAKLDRIHNLPYFLSLTLPGREIPAAIMKPIQADLTALRGQLHGPSPVALQAFNSQLRVSIGNASLSPQVEGNIMKHFTQAMESAGLEGPPLTQLTTDVERLVAFDTNHPEPVFTATNDTTTILQVALGVGRPIKQPGIPRLAADSRAVASNLHLVKAGVLQPYITGTYTASTTQAVNTILLLNESGNVIGTTTVGANGVYRVRPGNFLTDGTYNFRVQAMDAAGDFSAPSAVTSITVGFTRHPAK